MSGVLAQRRGVVDGAAAAVRETVGLLRSRRVKNEHAIELTAEQFGLSKRHVKSLAYGEPCVVAMDEYRRVTARFAALLDAEAGRLEHEAEALRLRALAVLRAEAESP
jgi:hypothetical protein